MKKKAAAKAAAAAPKPSATAKPAKEIDVSRLSDPQGLRNLMENARRLGREDMYWKAFGRLCELEGEAEEDPLRREFARMLLAYEELLNERSGKRMPAYRSRKKIEKRGMVESLQDWTLAEAPAEGFELLMANGLDWLTGEHLVVKYGDRFTEEVVGAARVRLETHTQAPVMPVEAPPEAPANDG